MPSRYARKRRFEDDDREAARQYVLAALGEERTIRRFVVEFTVTDEGCWEWARPHPDGYGRFFADGRKHSAHRWAFETFVEAIPAGLVTDHLCRNRACVNPDHLEPVTPRENTLRGETIPAVHASKTHCPHGHPYDEANTYIGKRGNRACRACNLISTHRRRGKAA